MYWWSNSSEEFFKVVFFIVKKKCKNILNVKNLPRRNYWSYKNLHKIWFVAIVETFIFEFYKIFVIWILRILTFVFIFFCLFRPKGVEKRYGVIKLICREDPLLVYTVPWKFQPDRVKGLEVMDIWKPQTMFSWPELPHDRNYPTFLYFTW